MDLDGRDDTGSMGKAYSELRWLLDGEGKYLHKPADSLQAVDHAKFVL
jgi:hypothetical protein